MNLLEKTQKAGGLNQQEKPYFMDLERKAESKSNTLELKRYMIDTLRKVMHPIFITSIRRQRPSFK